MSWYVEQLIRNSWYIKNRVVQETSTDLDELVGYSILQDSVYDDLLSVESAIIKLEFTKKEKEIIGYLSENAEITKIAKLTHLSRPTATDRINSITNRISLVLGDYFTNEGFAKMICDKRDWDQYIKVSILTFLEK